MLLGIVPLVIFLLVIIDIAVGAAAIAIVMAFTLADTYPLSNSNCYINNSL